MFIAIPGQKRMFTFQQDLHLFFSFFYKMLLYSIRLQVNIFSALSYIFCMCILKIGDQLELVKQFLIEFNRVFNSIIRALYLVFRLSKFQRNGICLKRNFLSFSEILLKRTSFGTSFSEKNRSEFRHLKVTMNMLNEKIFLIEYQIFKFSHFRLVRALNTGKYR